VPFRPLPPEAIRAIIKDRLNGSLTGVKQRSGIELTYGDEVIEEFVATMREAKYGVREIDSLIYEKLSPALAEAAKAQRGRERRGQLVVEKGMFTTVLS
jgi:ATP-dependent Clp protease ATP-binding subunit ClpA